MTTHVTEMMLISTRRFVIRDFGGDRWKDILDRMEPATRKAYEKELAASQRVDFPIVADLLKSVVDVLSKDAPDVMHRLGMHNAEDDLKITQRIIMKILTIKLVLKIASMLWTARVQDGGTMVIVDRGRKGAGCRIETPPDVSILWWKYLAGWFHRTIELAGGKNVLSTWTGGGEKPREAATFEVSWK